MATIATPTSARTPTSIPARTPAPVAVRTTTSIPASTSRSAPTDRSRALRSAEGLIAGYVHALAAAWMPDDADEGVAAPRGSRSVPRPDTAGSRAKTGCWTRGGRATSSQRFRPAACGAC